MKGWSGGGSQVKWFCFSASSHFNLTETERKTLKVVKRDVQLSDWKCLSPQYRWTTTVFLTIFQGFLKPSLIHITHGNIRRHLPAPSQTQNDGNSVGNTATSWQQLITTTTLTEFTVGVMNETIRGTQVVPIYKHKAKPAQVQKFIASLLMVCVSNWELSLLNLCFQRD